MTYAVALRLERGLVFAADTRTNAGLDNVAQFRKLHWWNKAGDRVVVILTAGNLSITQSVISLLNEQLSQPNNETEDDAPTIYTAPNMYRVARVVGDARPAVPHQLEGPARALHAHVQRRGPARVPDLDHHLLDAPAHAEDEQYDDGERIEVIPAFQAGTITGRPS